VDGALEVRRVADVEIESLGLQIDRYIETK